MYALFVDLRIAEAAREEFLAALRAQAKASLELEPGCLRFDVCEDVEDPDHFVLYEVYADEASFEGHRRTEHFARWAAVRNASVIEQTRTLTRMLDV